MFHHFLLVVPWERSCTRPACIPGRGSHTEACSCGLGASGVHLPARQGTWVGAGGTAQQPGGLGDAPGTDSVSLATGASVPLSCAGHGWTLVWNTYRYVHTHTHEPLQMHIHIQSCTHTSCTCPYICPHSHTHTQTHPQAHPQAHACTHHTSPLYISITTFSYEGYGAWGPPVHDLGWHQRPPRK